MSDAAPPTPALSKTYDPAAVEQPIYAMWEAGGYFRPAARRPGADAFCIIMPPPNVTGALHLGHAIGHTVQDVLIRWHRMLGDETLWLPGVDHAGIATQNVVEADLAKEGVSRHDIGREAFVERVWDWVRRYRGRITEQGRRLGASCDWEREVFTLDTGPQRAVRTTFRDLHAAGKIYRGHRIINWCPSCRTALSDLEVEHQEEAGQLWHVRYPFVDEDGREQDEGMVIATTRPETIPADVAIAVNPGDDRWKPMIERRVKLPIPGIDRTISVIADAAVEIEFGTGALKITPGHDMLDFEIGERHGLEAIRVIDWDGTMTKASGPYAGLDREVARERVIADLEAAGYLVRVEEHEHSVGHCQRCGTVVEPLVSNQWFVDVEELAATAAATVREGTVRIVPERFAKVYLQWMDNIRPWCISRQLWWGHRIPAWYCLRCDGAAIQVTVPRAALPEGGAGLEETSDGAGWAGSAAAVEAAGLDYAQIATSATEMTIGQDVETIVTVDDPFPEGCDRCEQGPLVQDPDVLDTWFSSGLWPHSTLGWPRETDDLARFYPGAVMETGYDILFFWVARMVMLGCQNMDGAPPFATVYLHGLVRDDQGRKMSKSLGNGIDPMEVSDQYGTDALRFTLATGSSPGNDMRLTDERLEGGRNFVNKLWNGARFVLGELGERSVQPLSADDPPEALTLEDRWILSRLDGLSADVDALLRQFQLGEAGRRVADFLWGEFFDWYVEASKVRLRAGDETPLAVLAHVLDQGLRLLHPFLPFVTEAIWQELRSHLATETCPALIIASYPDPAPAWADAEAEGAFAGVQEVVRAIRQVRADRSVQASHWIEAYVVTAEGESGPLGQRAALIEALARARPLHVVSVRAEAPDEQVISQVLDGAEVVLPLGGLVDLDQERARLAKQIDEAEQQQRRLEGKLANEGFTSKAPEAVVERERERLAEVEKRLRGLRDRLADLG